MKDKFLPIMLEKREEISMSNGEEMKVAVLLSMHCFEKNAGNRIKLGLKNSKNASWRGLLGLPHKKYEKLIEKGASGLWHCEGDDIIVDLYSVEMEARRNTKREQTSNAGKASAEARKERANQQGENSTDVQRTLNNIDQTIPDLNETETNTENALESPLSECDSNPFSKLDADKTPARGSDLDSTAEDSTNLTPPESADEVLSYMKSKALRLANDYPDIFKSVASEFYESYDLFNAKAHWKEGAMKLLNQRLIERHRAGIERKAIEPYPESSEEVIDYLKSLKACPIKDESELNLCAEEFFGVNAGIGWVDEQGKPVKNWKARAKNYAKACAKDWNNQRLMKFPRGKHRMVNPEPDNGTLR